MNSAAIVLLLGAVGVAGADWLAVHRGNRVVEYLCKPLVILLLVACALLLHPVSGTQRAFVVAALALSLVGDVFLMLPGDRFLPGLGAFLLAQLAFIAGFISSGFSAARWALAVTGLLVVGAVLMQRVLRALRAGPHRTPAPALVGYGVTLSLMVAFAFAGRQPLALVPALLFYFSDTLIAWRRFVAPAGWMPVAIIASYHLAQVGLVMALAL